MLSIRGLTKSYGRTLAVDDLSFDVQPGRVTGFLGPNGAGKSTTLRMMLGLATPTSGEATVDGRPFRSLRRPLLRIGALIDAGAVPPGRSGYQHLAALARSNGIARSRVDAVLDEVGLTSAARKRVGGYSLGMRQRLGIAATLLGDPGILVFDEPGNGLDPEGLRWLRTLFRRLAAEGRTVFVSSHLMSEMENAADQLVVIGRGRLIADTSTAEFVARDVSPTVTVRTPEAATLALLLIGEGAQASAVDGGLQVTGLPASRIGDLACANGVAIHELTPQGASLEAAFMALTSDTADYRTRSSGPGGEDA